MRSFAPATVIALSFLLLPHAAAAVQWVSLGPPGERSVDQIEIDADGAQNLYALLADVGVLRSEDAGATWQLGGEALRVAADGDLRPLELLADPFQTGDLYATVFGVGVYRSSDGGAHWHPADNRGLPAIPKPSDLEAHPTRPSTLYLATISDWIFVSPDGGESWSAPGPAPQRTNSLADLAVDPDDPATLYAVGSNETINRFEPFAFRSDDGGASWQRLDVTAALGFSTDPTLVVVPSGGAGTVYLADSAGRIFRSTDSGLTWTWADTGLPMSNEDEGVTVEGLAADPTDPATLYVSLKRLNGGSLGVFRTMNGGDQWQPFGVWPADQPAPRDFAFDPHDPSFLLAAPGPYLAPATADGAWASRRPMLPPHSHFVTPHPSDPDILYTDAAWPDLRRSRDGGTTWEPFGRSLPPTPQNGFSNLVVDPRGPRTLYVVGGKTVYKSVDGGLTWTERREGLDSVNGTADLLIAPADSQTLYTWDIFRLFRSTDRAASWSPIFDPDDHAVIATVAVDPSTPGRLYVGTVTPSGSDISVCRSDDGGDSFACVPTGRPDGGIGSLVVDPANPDRLYAVRGSFPTSANGFRSSYEVLRSHDGGRTWTPSSEGLPSVGLGDIVVETGPPGSPGTLWLATDGRGVYRSTDGGDSWIPVRQAMGPLRVAGLALGPGGLHAATALGVFRLDPSAGAGDPLPPDEVPWLEDSGFPGFRFKVRIDQGGGHPLPGTKEAACIPETVCVSGALPGRSELFLRIVGPKPNGWLWPTLVKFSTSRIEVWIERPSTGRLRYYELTGASPGVDELPGLFDRFGFPVLR